MAGDARRLIDTAARDRQSGSAAVARTAARGLVALAAGATDPESFAGSLDDACTLLVTEQARLAAVWSVANDCLLAAEGADRGHAARAVVRAATSFERRAATAHQRITASLDRVLPGSPATIVTCSSSSTLEQAFLSLGARGRIARLLCCRSLPGGEGEALSSRLAAAEVAAEVIEDAAVGPATALADCAVFGADLVSPDVLVNKVGSRPLALAATAQGRPALVVADHSKVLPGVLADAVRQACAADPTEAVFEEIPWSEVTGWLSDRGLEASADVAATAAAVPVASRLRSICSQR